MADQYEHARSHSAESYESGPSSQASTVPGPAYNNYGKDRYDNEYSQVELVSHRLVCSVHLHDCQHQSHLRQPVQQLQNGPIHCCDLQADRQSSFIDKKGGEKGTLAR